MLNPVKWWSHVLVAVAVITVPILIVLGLMGRGSHPERFDSKLIVVTPAGDGVHVREVVDEDFGNSRRHGYERIIPDDFGAPVEVTASSPNAPDDVSVVDDGSQTVIRVGDPSTTLRDRRRYILDYTLPNAHLSTGTLLLDIIGDQDTQQTVRFEVVLNGFTLTDPVCHVGVSGTVGGCTLRQDGPLYRVVFAPLPPRQGVTVGGTIRSTNAPTVVASPPLPPQRHVDPWPLAIGALLVGGAAAGGLFVFARRIGRDEVGGATAADAAYGGPATATALAPVRLVTDEELATLATTEFEPPRGIRPWQGALVLREVIDDETISAWFGDQISQQVVELHGTGAHATLVAGPHLAEAPPITRQRIERLFGTDGTLELGKYQPRLATLWTEIRAEQKASAAASGWWKRRPPGSGSIALALSLPLVGGVVLANVKVSTVRDLPVFTILSQLAVAGLFAIILYQQLLPARTAAGSAMALRTESFRRFLQASEGKHVDWAYQHGLLREYSAWAVALHAADAWGRAVAASAVPPPELAINTMPLFMHTNAAAWRSTFTAPHSSGSGGSGGFSGGGGGGGSSGSW